MCNQELETSTTTFFSRRVFVTLEVCYSLEMFLFFSLGEFELSYCFLSVEQASKRVVISARFKNINKRVINSRCFCDSDSASACH